MKQKFNKQPHVRMPDTLSCASGWEAIAKDIQKALKPSNQRTILVLECYHGVNYGDLMQLFDLLQPAVLINAQNAMHSPKTIESMVMHNVTDDRVFGRMATLSINDYYHQELPIDQFSNCHEGLVVIYGIGASIVCENWDILVYADMARWEIQQRMRRHQLDSIGLRNRDIDWMRLYKQGYFLDWRLCDQLKRRLISMWDFVLDTSDSRNPKMVTGSALREGLSLTSKQPFSLVPFFDPGPWGGEWMEEICELPGIDKNYAWCFNCVPEENSLLLKFGEVFFETPSINLVFYRPLELLGENIYERFGAEFPIRFDFLDTIKGGNLSLQVHPSMDYIKEHFGMTYTQDESYYMMEAEQDAVVYLGFKREVQPHEVLDKLELAEKGEKEFRADDFIASWPVKKHDHVSIPSGTIHCSGAGSMVLEISATPYIFTFKLWDWGRLGLDGKPRPIHLEHGKQVLRWDRREYWVRNNLINLTEKVAEEEGWIEERTGLDKDSFIETRRHWFTDKVLHDTQGTVNILCLVEGKQVLVESPENQFDPFVVNYAEVFVVPAQVGPYSIRPCGPGTDAKTATLKAYVRE